jgi:tetratricopeptide (TPR) repeat protein
VFASAPSSQVVDSGQLRVWNMTADGSGVEQRTARAQAASRPGTGAVPWWLLAIVFALFAAVLIVGGLVANRLTTRDLAAARVRDSRLQELERTVAERPNDLDARVRLAYAYQQNSLNREALKQYRQVLSADPNNLAALYNTGVIQLQTGKKGAAEKSLTRVLELAPQHALAAYALGRHYADAGDEERALAISLPAADAHPDDADLQYTAGLALENAGRFAEAAIRYEAALKLVPNMDDAKRAIKRLEGAR